MYADRGIYYRQSVRLSHEWMSKHG